ncbi:selenide, water dikinase SelD [Sagittula stellata]|uniref:Selenide,water dikinase, putative n=1 Tax=Sagittula stellata (strain ATCC 700073 / DSM 11524 / E-37) TaxID=388399 RepID=A3K8E2_SAGS3|nr:selenide, water dikinase SelD [Sagittula stellata]EBA06621.1 selenide,water dikinase, putative [Sagittula stellata E-37]
MQEMSLPYTRDLLLIGGGHSHALVLRMWGMSDLPGARVTVVNPEPTAPYSGMLPGHLAGHYDRRALDIDLVQLGRFAGARVVVGRVIGLDTEARVARLEDGRRIAFDVASIDVGVTSDMPTLPGFAEHAVPAKPLGPFASAWARFLEDSGPAKVAVIGGGVAGAEISLAMAHALALQGRPAEVHLVERDRALSGLPPRSATHLRAALARMGVTVHEDTDVQKITENAVRIGDQVLEADFVCGAAGARPQEWFGDTGLNLQNGFVAVGPTLESSVTGIFATGDCAHMTASPRPKAGVYAVRQAPVLLHNLRQRLSGKDGLKTYRPQRDYLKLISLGEKAALGDRFGMTFQGKWAWRWKDHIDRSFMNRFRDLPTMTQPALPQAHADGLADLLAGKPLCGGCGAKVGQEALMAALAETGGTALPGDDAAVLTVGAERMVLSTDHLREIVRDPEVMTRLAAHHALGDIWAMGAEPLSATANIVLPQMASRLAGRTLREVMSAAHEVMAEAGTTIVGGHTSQGAEMTIGFTILGRAHDTPITLDGARPGDILVLTKPVGSGLIMAAEMQGLAEGDWVAGALRHMTRSQGAASRLLRVAHAMTDVTGFGLAGHLRNICLNSAVGAELWLDDVPLLDGALELAGTDLRASLFAENRALVPDAPAGPRADLLFDPQTAGGLLAAVPEAELDVLDRLRDAGYPAAEIGRITDRVGQISIV